MHEHDAKNEKPPQDIPTLERLLKQEANRRKRAEGILVAQQRVLTAITNGVSLSEVLDVLCRAIETLSIQGICAIALRARHTLRLRAVTSLPASYTRAIDGLRIGPASCSSGTAAYRGVPVIVQDIANDPLWSEHRAVALRHDLRACSSLPILSTHGKVLGTFDFYYREVRALTSHDQYLGEVATRLAALAVKHLRLGKVLRRNKTATVTHTRSRGLFLASVSQDLQALLRQAQHGVEQLTTAALSPEQRNQIAVLTKGFAQLQEMGDDLHDLSLLESESRPLAAVPFPLRQRLSSLLPPFAQQAAEQGKELICRVHSETPEMLIGDPERLERVLRKIVKHLLDVPGHEEVFINIGYHLEQTARQGKTATAATPQEAGRLEIHVTARDPRLGVSSMPTISQEMPGAYRPGQPVASLAGWALPQQLIEAMGGWLWQENLGERGHTIHCMVPCQLADQASTPSTSLTLARVYQAPVLVVDGNATVRQVLVEMLSRWGMRPVAEASGQGALHALQQAKDVGQPFNFVLVDTRLPDMDGWRLARHILAHPLLATTPLVMMSATANAEEIIRCQDLGVRSCVPKPVLAPALWEALVAACSPSSPALRTSPGTEAELGGEALRILLAEDNPINQIFARRLLEKRGHTVIVAQTGREACAAFEHEKFDVVLMDLQMPELDGLEAVAAIRRYEQIAGGHIPIIAMTAYAMPEDRERCLTAGMDEYLAKPLQIHDLLSAIARVVKTTPQQYTTPSGLSFPADVFHHNAALARTEGDVTLLQELIALFLEEYPSIMTALHAALQRGDMLTFSQLAHNIRGTVESFAATEAAIVAQRLEQYDKQEDIERAREACEELEVALVRLVQALQVVMTA